MPGLLGTPLMALLEVITPGLSDTAFGLISQLFGFTLFIVYSILITTTRGQTLGKYLLSLQIVDAGSLAHPADAQVVRRFFVLGLSLLFCAVALPLLGVPGVGIALVAAGIAAPAALRPDHRALHDLAAGTAVVLAPPGASDGASEARP